MVTPISQNTSAWQHSQALARVGRHLTLHTWRPSFSNAYQISVQGLSAEQTSNRLHGIAHEWVRAKFPHIAPRDGSDPNAPLFGTGEGASPARLSCQDFSLTSVPFTANEVVSVPEVPRHAWHVELQYLDSSTPGRSWRVALGCKTIEGEQAPAVLLSVELAHRDVVLAADPVLTVPFVNFLLDKLTVLGSNADAVQMKSGRTILSASPILVHDESSVRRLFMDLRDETRTHPVVLISGHIKPDGSLSYLVDPDKIARSLHGVATVFVEGPIYLGSSRGLKDVLVEQLGFDPELLAWGGAVRVYNQGDAESPLAPQHPYFVYRPYQSEGQVSAMIRERCLQLARYDLRAHTQSPILRPEDIDLFSTREQLARLQGAPQEEKDPQGLKREVDEWKAIATDYADENTKLRGKIQAMGGELQSTRDQLSQLSSEREELVATNRELQDELDRLQRVEIENASLKAELARSKAKEAGSASRAGAARQAQPEELTSGEAIYTQVRELFADRIAFTKRGAKTLSEFAVDGSNQALYQKLFTAFEDLHSKLWPLRFPERDPNLERHFNENSQSVALAMTEGKGTKKDNRLSKMREDVFEGKNIDAWMHLKYGNVPGRQFRVHFDFVGEGEQGRIVVSWVGDHMENASSTKSGKRA